MLAVLLVAAGLLAGGGLIARHLVVDARLEADTYRAGAHRWQAMAEGLDAEHHQLATEATGLRVEREMLNARVIELETPAVLRLDPGQARLLAERIKVASPVMPGVLPDIETSRFDQQKCQHCGGIHSRACPRVRRIVYADSGKPAEVEFWPAGRWPTDDVLWFEDVIEAAEEVADERQHVRT